MTNLNGMETVTALVVTYNRLSDLKICLDSLRSQTRPLDKILVVNNGSNDGTFDWLTSQSDIEVINQGNLGGAGGFATGIEAGYQMGFTWVWCMDDDCIAAPDALEQLLLSPNVGPCIKNAMSVSTTNDKELAFYVNRPNKKYRIVSDMTDCDLVYGVASVFNGTLIHRGLIAKIGVPDRTLFIWGDEVEYMTRAQKSGFPIFTVPKSVFRHPPSFDRNGIPWPGAWKQYYAVRNQRRVFQNLYGNVNGVLVFMRWVVKEIGQQAIMKRANRLYNVLLYGEAAVDGTINNFRKRPDSILTVRLYRLFNK